MPALKTAIGIAVIAITRVLAFICNALADKFIRLGVPAIFPKAFAETNAVPGTPWITPETFVKENYHRPSDDLSLPRDSASAVRFVRFMADIARRVANADEAPRWNAGDFFGDKFGRSPVK